MADIDLKTATPDTTLPATGFLFGADSQASASPSVYSTQSVATTLLGSTTLSGTTITADAPVLNPTQTWNNAGVTFTGAKLNITDTASNAASLLMDLQVGGASKVRVDKTGAIVNTLNTYGTSNFTLRGGASQNFGINLQSITAYFQTNSAVGVGITVSGSAGSVGVSNNGSFGFHTTVPGADAIDTFLTRRGAANLRLGAADVDGSPVPQFLSAQSTAATTTSNNVAGANFTIDGSQGTGTGVGGSIIFRVAPIGLSGNTRNALATALTIDTDLGTTLFGNLKFNSSSTIVTFGGSAGIALNGLSGSVFRTSIGISTGNPVSGASVILIPDAANTLALRNGTNAQTFNVYNTFTDASNYERLNIGWDGSGSLISFTAGGTGNTARAVRIVSNLAVLSVGSGVGGGAGFTFGSTSTNWWSINSSGHFIAATDNTYDIGAVGATRPRNLFLAGTATITGSVAAGAIVSIGNGSVALKDGGSLVLQILNNAQTAGFVIDAATDGTAKIRLRGNAAFGFVQGKLQTETAYTAGTVVATGYLTLYDSTGTAYRVPCLV